MNTAWVLVFIFYPFATYSTSFTVENLVSTAECERVAQEVIKWRKEDRSAHKCIEVIRK
jgi:hypothetical protein